MIRGNDMWHEYLRNNKMLWASLCVFGVCGLVGVLVDLDHIPFILGLAQEPRLLHLSIAVTSGIVLLGTLSYLGGLLLMPFLRKRG
jgi:hypothetical protein